jgi:hypothetical protein
MKVVSRWNVEIGISLVKKGEDWERGVRIWWGEEVLLSVMWMGGRVRR